MARAAALHWGGARQGALRFTWPQPPAAGLHQVIAGGEGGVDRAAAHAAHALGYKSGGCTQKGRQRAALNVRDSDATLIVYNGAPDEGVRRAEEIAHSLGKPVITVDLADLGGYEQAKAWLARTSPRVLNITGGRGARDVGLYARSFAMLVRLLGPCPVRQAT